MEQPNQPVMHFKCRQWIVEILESHRPLVSLAVRQRAKFEGWLKFELAWRAERDGASVVRVEESNGQGARRIDVAFRFGDLRYFLQLKTPNANWRIPGICNKGRPITKNIASIVKDARILRGHTGQGIVGFVLFPVPKSDGRWKSYLERIANDLEVVLSEKEHCARVNVPVGDHQTCEAIVCCFSVPRKEG